MKLNFFSLGKLQNRIFKFLNFTLLLFIASVLIFNFINYPQEKAYDYDLIYWYTQGLPTQLPTPEQNPAYYHPPLPYFFSSIIDSICDAYYKNDEEIFCDFLWHKAGSFLQIILFTLTTYFYFKIFSLIVGNNKNFDKNSFIFLLFFSIPTINYKTFSMIRAEPYLVFLTGYLLYEVFKAMSESNIGLKFSIKIGTISGLLLLTKQSSIAIFIGLIPAIFYLYYKLNISLKKLFFLVLLSLFIAFSIGGWFYWGQFTNYGSIDSFPREKEEFSFDNHHKNFYTGFDFNEVINHPFKFHSESRILQILYSDTWADYWGYYTFDRNNIQYTEIIENQLVTTSNFLKLSTVPTLVFILSFIYIIYFLTMNFLNKRFNFESWVLIICVLIATLVLLFFIYFITVYPYFTWGEYNFHADTVKAIYIAPFYNLISLFSAVCFAKLNKSNALTTNIVLIYCYLFIILNFDSFTSSF